MIEFLLHDLMCNKIRKSKALNEKINSKFDFKTLYLPYHPLNPLSLLYEFF